MADLSIPECGYCAGCIGMGPCDDQLGHLHEEDHWDDDVDEGLDDEDLYDWPDGTIVRPIETVHLPAEDVT